MTVEICILKNAKFWLINNHRSQNLTDILLKMVMLWLCFVHIGHFSLDNTLLCKTFVGVTLVLEVQKKHCKKFKFCSLNIHKSKYFLVFFPLHSDSID